MEQEHIADKSTPASLLAVQEASTVHVLVEKALVEGVSTLENKDEAVANVLTEKVVLEVPEGPTMKHIFSEIQLLAKTGPNRHLIEVFH